MNIIRAIEGVVLGVEVEAEALKLLSIDKISGTCILDIKAPNRVTAGVIIMLTCTMGYNRRYQKITARLLKSGFGVVVPNLEIYPGDAKVFEDGEECDPVHLSLRDQSREAGVSLRIRSVSQIRSLTNHIANYSGYSVGILGFSIGGAVAMKAASESAASAIVAYNPPNFRYGLRVDMVDNLTCPAMIHLPLNSPENADFTSQELDRISNRYNHLSICSYEADRNFYIPGHRDFQEHHHRRAEFSSEFFLLRNMTGEGRRFHHGD